nr:SIS domain-containing protein [Tissierella sp.]
MFGIKEEVWKEKNGLNTASEIYRQNDLWLETFKIIEDKKEDIKEFLKELESKKDTRIIFTGAGTSDYVGKTIVDYLNSKYEHNFESIASTDIVSSPELYLKEDVPTIFVSFARSGSSPESIITFDLGEQIIKDVKHIFITCNENGKMERLSREHDNVLLLLMPKETHDKGFAMTSSFTNMLLAALLTFDIEEIEEKKQAIQQISQKAKRLMDNSFEKIQEIVDLDYDRNIFLGSGGLKGVAIESALKVLELTRGKTVTLSETLLGFRHGPKSILSDKSLVFAYVSTDSHTYKYDYDLIKEVYSNPGNHKVITISETYNKELDEVSDYNFNISDEKTDIEEAYLSIMFVIYAQMFSLLSSLKKGIEPDNPSPDGLVNRVVEGVTLHLYNK